MIDVPICVSLLVYIGNTNGQKLCRHTGMDNQKLCKLSNFRRTLQERIGRGGLCVEIGRYLCAENVNGGGCFCRFGRIVKRHGFQL
jgi:hypothetical protein